MDEVLDYVRKEFGLATVYYDNVAADYVSEDNDLATQRFERFKTLHSAIWNEQTEIKQRFVIIGAILYEIRRDEIYKSVRQPAHGNLGYNNFYVFCQDVFGFKKTTIVNLLNVFDNFCNKDSGLLDVEYINFSYSQLVELSRMDKYRERISVTTSVRDIRKLNEYYKTNSPKPGNSIADDLADYKAQKDEEKRLKDLKKSKLAYVPDKKPIVNGEKSDGQTSDHQENPPDQGEIRMTLGENDEVQTSEPQNDRTCYDNDSDQSSSYIASFDTDSLIKGLTANLDMLKTNAPEWGRLVDCVQMAFNKGDPSYFAKRRDYVALEIENLSLKEKLEKSQCGVNPSYIKSEGASGDKLSLKNEKERKEWLKRFRSWGVWIEVPELDQSYYRYNFANGTSLIVLVANSFNVWSDSTSHSFELIRYSIIDDKRSSYDSSGVSFSDVVNWLTKNSSLI